MPASRIVGPTTSSRTRSGSLRAATATSLLEPSGAAGWRLGASLETELSSRVPLVGVSLVLDRPRLAGPYHGYPWDPQARRALARSPLRRVVNGAPAVLRRQEHISYPGERSVVRHDSREPHLLFTVVQPKRQ